MPLEHGFAAAFLQSRIEAGLAIFLGFCFVCCVCFPCVAVTGILGRGRRHFLFFARKGFVESCFIRLI